MSLLLDYHSSANSAPPPYAPSPGASVPPISLPAHSISNLPHRYYPMHRRMELNEAEGDSSSVTDATTDDRVAGSTSTPSQLQASNSLFSPASVMTDPSSMDDQQYSSFVPTTAEQQTEAGLPDVELFETNISGTELPEYSTGAQITRAPTEPEQSALSRLNQHLLHHHHGGDDDRVTSALTIRVDRTKFSIGEVIQGTIMFVPWRKKDNNTPQAITGVNLLLFAQETTYSNPGSNTSVACSHTYKLGYHIVPEMAMPPDGTVSPGYIYSFPFSVQVPNVKVSPEEECKCAAHIEHTHLAPSFSRPGVKVEYQLCATVRGPQISTLTSESRIVALCRDVCELEIVPSYPPLAAVGSAYSDDSDTDMSVYSTQADLKFGTTLKTLWRSGGSSSSSSKKTGVAANGRLSLQLGVPTGSNGSPLRLALDRVYSTLLPLELEFVGKGVPSIQRTSLELRSTTRYLVSRKFNSLDQARANPKLAATAIKTVTETVVLAQHEMKAGCQFVESATAGRHTVSVSIPLAWDPAAILLSSTAVEPLASPTTKLIGARAQIISASFKSCFVEHEHELELNVFVAGGVAMKKSVCVSLHVPLEIIATT